MRVTLSMLVVINFFTCLGQGKGAISSLQKESMEWNEGSILLSDETLLKGKVQFNDYNGTLSFKTQEGSESYLPNSVIKFEFFDEGIKEYRNFITLEYPTEELKKGIIGSYYSLTDFDSRKGRGAIMPTFFEVLKEANRFVVLSKLKPIEYKEKASGGGSFMNPAPVIVYDEIKQNEIIFFLDTEGNMTPYIEFSNKETYNVTFKKTDSTKKTKKRKLDSGILEEITGELYPKLEEYAEMNKLKLTRRIDFLKIMDYYITIQI